MDATLTDSQNDLRTTARAFLSDRCPPSLVRDATEQGPASEQVAKLWAQMAEMGWMGVGFDQAEGGQGLALLDRAVLAEEMGRALVPAPWFSAVCLAGEAVSVTATAAQRQKWLPRLASGDLHATLALLEPDTRLGAQAIRATAVADGDGYLLHGSKAFVPDLSGAEMVVVAARVEGEPALFAVDTGALEVRQDPTIDGTRPLAAIELEGVYVPGDRLLGDEPCGWAAIERALDRATAVLCAEMCGGAQKVLDLAVDYAKSRQQFGRPIGSFQGVSHRCAEMLLAIEGARSLSYYAAWCCDEDVAQAALATSAAKVAASEAYRSATAQAIQIHGGIGFTWEADLHLWYRRAFWSAALLGDAVYHRERVASLLQI